jgi:hypothetical protein
VAPTAATFCAAFADADDGDWGFGRDALGVPAQEHVEHRIADDSDAQAGGRRKERGQTWAGDEIRGHGFTLDTRTALG